MTLRRSDISTMSLEKRVLTEIIHLYREFPCLWDNRQVLYSNKEAREQAYEVLLEKYRVLQEDATILDLKKRIENMRCCYRREHKKVLLSRVNGDDPEHLPQLWYYELMFFLNDVMDFSRLESIPRENSDETLKLEFDDSPPKIRVKKRKAISMSTIYLPEQQDSDEDVDHADSDVMPLNPDNNHNSLTTLNVNGVTESEAFGTTVGLQLKELDPMQRVISEKLISDIIFNARLNRLSLSSNVNI
ncbi:uncharacterized protein LOC126367503 [Pectinophora gossypiella]|nr:uncharacterized protein LOC126367503 [Pectinophora gossypiella]